MVDIAAAARYHERRYNDRPRGASKTLDDVLRAACPFGFTLGRVRLSTIVVYRS